MYCFETRSAVMLVLTMGLVANSVWAADFDSAFGESKETMLLAANEGGGEGGAQVKSSGQAQAGEVTESTSSWTRGSSDAATGGAFFGGEAGGIGANQRSATANYQLGGTGITASNRAIEGAIMTAPARGRPLRFENGIFVYPAVMLGYGRNDNVLGTKTGQIASNFYVLRPELMAELKTHGDRYTVSYSGNYGRYENSSADNFDYHEFSLAGDNYFTTRARLGWGAGYIKRSDPRGSTDSSSGSEPNRWHAPVIRAIGIYGAPGSIGRIELEGSRMDKRYENNRASTESLDVNLTSFAGRFFYRFMPKTSVVFEARQTWADYVLATSTSDNTDRRLYAGLVWEATAKTTGTLKLGRAYKNFDDSSRRDAGMASWEASLRWSPLTYSNVDLVASKAPTDSTGVGNFITNNATTLTWNHKWASYISSRVNFGYIKSDYDADPRRDKTKNYGIGFFHELGYQMRLGLDWQRTDRSSNLETYDFKRDVTMITLEAVL